MRLLRLLATVATVMMATSASALAPCGDLVVDNAGVLTNEPALEQAAAALERATGAMVRVRVSKSFAPEPSLLDYANTVLEDVCPSWRGTRGGAKSNLILLWFADDVGDIGVYYGNRWDARFLVRAGGTASSNEDLVLDAMMPAIDLDDVDTGMRLGLEAIMEILVDKPVTPRVTEPTPPKPAPVVVPAVKSEPVDMRPFLALIAGVFIILVLFFTGRTALRHQATARREAAVLEAAKIAAREALDRVSEVSINTDDARKRLEPAIVAATAVSSLERVADWQQAEREFEGKVTALRGELNTVTNPGLDNLPLDTYNNARAAFEELLPRYESLRDDITKLAETIEGVPALATAIPVALDELRSNVVADVGQFIADLGRDDFVTTGPDELLQAGEALVDQMRTAMAARDWTLAASLLTEAREQFGEARAAAERLPQRRQEAIERLAALREKLGSFAERKTNADAIMQAMVEEFTKDCYTLVADNNTKAAGIHDELEGRLTALEKLIASQDWDAVETALEAAEDDWADIVDLYTSVGERYARLQEMIPDADAEMAEAARSIEAAEDYLGRQSKYNTLENQSVVATLKSDLAQVPELKKGTPLPIVERFRLATVLDDAADTFLAQIEARVADDIERAKRAERLLKDIGTRIAEYDRYAMLHRGDISPETLDDLIDAREDYGRLKRVNDVDERLATGATLSQLLDTFHTAAKQEVSEAEAERKRAREAAEALALAAEQKRDAVRRAATRRNNSPSFGGGGLDLSFGNSRPSRSSYSGPSGLGGGTRSVGFSSLGGSTRSASSSGLSGGTRRASR